MNQTQLNKGKHLKHFIPFNQGLFNLNNTCYMNSILTCVSQLDEFLLRYGSNNILPFLASLDNKSLFKSLHHFIIVNFQNKDYLDFLQEALVDNIHEKNIFLRGQQNDANEYLVFLLIG
jgi:ubiquitin C-terminal hydrolase